MAVIPEEVRHRITALQLRVEKVPPHAAVTLSREQLCDVLAAVLALDEAMPR